MHRHRHFGLIALTLSTSVAAACGPSSQTGSSDSSSSSTSSSSSSSSAGGGAGAVAIAVTPTSAGVLTCASQALTATVTGAADTAVTWSIDGEADPAKTGSIDASGLFKAPLQVPSPASVTVTATSKADPTKHASSTLTLSTALPGAAAAPGASSDASIFHHQIAASGKSVYAVLLTTDESKPTYTFSLGVSASADGGQTFGKPVVASDVADAEVRLFCPSIAVDAGDPQTVYVAYLIDAFTGSKTANASTMLGGTSAALAVSKDGGKSFTNYVLEAHVSGWGDCPDVASPAPGTVVVEAPGYNFSDVYLTTYVDTNKGAGFAAGTGDMYAWFSGEHYDQTTGFNVLEYNGGSYGMESPRLFTDGKGKLCVTYVGGHDSTSGDGKTRVAVQCSSDGKAWSAPADVALEAMSTGLHHPIGAFGPDGVIAVAYWTDDTNGARLRLATSKDGGKMFTAPSTIPSYALPSSTGLIAFPQYPAIAWEGSTLWLAYLVGDGVGPNRLVVDKSCDGGATWSGAQLLNGPEPMIADDMQWPGLLLADGKPRVFAQKHPSGGVNDPYALIQLTP